MKLDITARFFFDNKNIHPELFLPLFQKGFMVETQVGLNIDELLTDHLGLSPDYVEDRVRTVFLDGKPVDDFKKAIVKHVSRIKGFFENTFFARAENMADFSTTTLCRSVHLITFAFMLTSLF